MLFRLYLITAIVNMKGGVGKTTLSVNLAWGLAKYHDKRVLLVDLDPQSNATQYLMEADDYKKYLEDPNRCTVQDIFMDRPTINVGTGSKSTQHTKEVLPTLENSAIRIYGDKGSTSYFDLIPSRLELMEAEALSRGVENRLKMFLGKISGNYDIILLDCPPTMGIFTLSSFIAADSYLVPLKPDYLSSVGLPLINKAIRTFQKNFPINLNYLGLVFTMVQITNLMKGTMETLKANQQNKCFNSTLSHSTKIAETVQNRKSIFDLLKERYSTEMVNIVDEFAKTAGISK